MIESQTSMPTLTIYRRHTKSCPHQEDGRDWIKCNCPVWMDSCENGRRTKQKSLKTRDWARARKLAGEEIDNPEEKPAKPLDEAVSAYLVHCEYLNENTRRKYRNRLEKQLLPFCQSAGITTLQDLTVEMLDAFRAQRSTPSGERLALTTSRRELETLRQFFAFCLERQWIDDNPAKRIKPPNDSRPEEIHPYNRDELDKILDAAGRIGKTDYERRRARAIVLLLRFCALRISDIATLERSRIKDSSILLYTRKTGGMILLPIPPELDQALKTLPTPHGADPKTSRYFFINESGSPRTAVSVVERCLAAVFRLSGVKDAHAHRFRHTLATQILASGGTMRDVADILGITEDVAERHYAKWDANRQNRIVSVLRTVHSGTKLGRGLKLVVVR
jgi:integrase/recombinase XerC